MDIETTKIVGQFIVVILLLTFGFLSEKTGKDGDGYFFCAFMAFVWFVN